MKKIMQRFLGIAAAAALIVTCAVPVMATSAGDPNVITSPSSGYTITLKETETEKDGKYGAYQIFTGTIPEPSSGTTVEPGKDNTTLKLTDIKWGNAFGDGITRRDNVIKFVIALATAQNSKFNPDYSYAFSDFNEFVGFVNSDDLDNETDIANIHLANRFYKEGSTSKLNEDVDLDQLAIEVAEELEKHSDRVWLQKFTDILGGYAKEGDGYAAKGYTTQYYQSEKGSDGTEPDGTKYVEYKITVPAGYYMIREFTDIGSGKSEALSARLLFVANNITQTLKTDVPTLKKNIIRDAVGGASTSAPTRTERKTEAAGVGDTVTFQLTATLPDNYDNFVGGYLFTFKDTFSEGLTVKAEDVEVSVTGYYDDDIWKDETHIIDPSTDYAEAPGHKSHIDETTEKQVYVVNVNEDDHTLTIDFPCIREILFDDDCRLGYNEADGKTSTIYVEYTATVNENALVYPAEIAPAGGTITKRNGNLNTATLTYSDNPQAHDQTDDTTSESATVYTYGLTIDKVDAAKFIENDGNLEGENVALQGAVFALVREKAGESGTYQIAYLSQGTVEKGSFDKETVYKIVKWNKEVTVTDSDLAQTVASAFTSGTFSEGKITSDTDGKINISGLNDGVTYYLVEIETPKPANTYATIKPFTLKLTAAIKNDEYTGLLADDNEENNATDGIIMDDHEIKTDKDESLSIDKFVQVLNNDVPASTADKDGIAELIVANFKYVDLPSTGGTGTYIFYIIGGVVVAASLVLFFLSRKKTTK